MALAETIENVKVCITCSLCEKVFRNPHTIFCCSHSFCRLCIDAELNSSRKCPKCSKRFTSSDIIRDTFLEGIVDAINSVCASTYYFPSEIQENQNVIGGDMITPNNQRSIQNTQDESNYLYNGCLDSNSLQLNEDAIQVDVRNVPSSFTESLTLSQINEPSQISHNTHKSGQRIVMDTYEGNSIAYELDTEMNSTNTVDTKIVTDPLLTESDNDILGPSHQLSDIVPPHIEIMKSYASSVTCGVISQRPHENITLLNTLGDATDSTPYLTSASQDIQSDLGRRQSNDFTIRMTETSGSTSRRSQEGEILSEERHQQSHHRGQEPVIGGINSRRAPRETTIANLILSETASSLLSDVIQMNISPDPQTSKSPSILADSPLFLSRPSRDSREPPPLVTEGRTENDPINPVSNENIRNLGEGIGNGAGGAGSGKKRKRRVVFDSYDCGLDFETTLDTTESTVPSNGDHPNDMAAVVPQIVPATNAAQSLDLDHQNEDSSCMTVVPFHLRSSPNQSSPIRSESVGAVETSQAIAVTAATETGEAATGVNAETYTIEKTQTSSGSRHSEVAPASTTIPFVITSSTITLPILPEKPRYLSETVLLETSNHRLPTSTTNSAIEVKVGNMSRFEGEMQLDEEDILDYLVPEQERKDSLLRRRRSPQRQFRYSGEIRNEPAEETQPIPLPLLEQSTINDVCNVDQSNGNDDNKDSDYLKGKTHFEEPRGFVNTSLIPRADKLLSQSHPARAEYDGESCSSAPVDFSVGNLHEGNGIYSSIDVDTPNWGLQLRSEIQEIKRLLAEKKIKHNVMNVTGRHGEPQLSSEVIPSKVFIEVEDSSSNDDKNEYEGVDKIASSQTPMDSPLSPAIEPFLPQLLNLYPTGHINVTDESKYDDENAFPLPTNKNLHPLSSIVREKLCSCYVYYTTVSRSTKELLKRCVEANLIVLCEDLPLDLHKRKHQHTRIKINPVEEEMHILVTDGIREGNSKLTSQSTANQIFLSKRSVRYLQALCLGIWIVDGETWLQSCLNLGRAVDPTPYEIKGCTFDFVLNGPYRSRIAPRDKNGNSSLLEGYCFLIIGGQTGSISDAKTGKVRDNINNRMSSENNTINRRFTMKDIPDASVTTLKALSSASIYRQSSYDMSINNKDKENQLNGQDAFSMTNISRSRDLNVNLLYWMIASLGGHIHDRNIRENFESFQKYESRGETLLFNKDCSSLRHYVVFLSSHLTLTDVDEVYYNKLLDSCGIGADRTFVTLRFLLDTICTQKIPVNVEGETGVGKDIYFLKIN